jgi:hypothetical protein
VVTDLLPDFEMEELEEGLWSCSGNHADGTLLPLDLEIKRVELASGANMACLWIRCSLPDYILELAASLNGAPVSASPVTKNTGLPIASPNATPVSVIGEKESTSNFHALYLIHDLNIGQGSFGTVRLCTDRATGQDAVVKIVQKSKVLASGWEISASGESFPKEALLLAELQHPHIVSLIHVFPASDVFYLVMARLSEHSLDLFEFLERNHQLHEHVASFITRQIASALEYMHQKGILHRDIKDENVILDRRLHAQLIDFGSV